MHAPGQTPISDYMSGAWRAPEFRTHGPDHVRCPSCHKRTHASVRLIRRWKDIGDDKLAFALTCPVCYQNGVLTVTTGPRATREDARVAWALLNRFE